MRVIYMLCLLFFLQVEDNSFYDQCGNEIIVQYPEKLPPILTQDFFQKTFSSSLLKDEICNHQYKFIVNIQEVKQISENKYDMRISIFPKKKSQIEDVMKYLGYSHYILRTKKNKNQIELKSFKFAYSEI